MTTETYFYHEGFKKAVIIFGSRFNNIKIKRYSNNTTESQFVSVPLSYAPIQHELARLQSDISGKRDVNIILPRMSFEITDISRDAERVVNTTNRIRSTNDISYYSPTPYKLNFELNIMAKNMEDSLKIVEQIIPFFNPKLAITAQLLDNTDDIFDIPLTLTDINLQDTYDSDFLTRRYIIWTLQFEMNYWFFGQTTTAKPIKFVKTNIYSDPAMTLKDVMYTAQPGLTANGTPTTTSNNSIAYNLINADDNYGFIFTANTNPV